MSGAPPSLGLEMHESREDGEHRDVVPAGCYGKNIGNSYVKGLLFQLNETHVFSTSKVATTTVKLYSHFAEPQ